MANCARGPSIPSTTDVLDETRRRRRVEFLPLLSSYIGLIYDCGATSSSRFLYLLHKTQKAIAPTNNATTQTTKAVNAMEAVASLALISLAALSALVSRAGLLAWLFPLKPLKRAADASKQAAGTASALQMPVGCAFQSSLLPAVC